MPNSEPVQSVVRALDMLRFVVESQNGLHLNEIARLCQLKAPTAHSLLRTLVLCGFLSKDGEGRYASGPTFYELSCLGRQNQLLMQAGDVLRTLIRRFPDATVTFSYLSPDGIRRLLRMSPDRPGQIQHPVETPFPPYLSATAVCLQATAVNAPIYEQNHPFEDYGLARWQTLENFLKAKQDVRRNGFYCIPREVGLGAAFAVPDNYALGISFLETPAEGFESVRDAMEKAVRSLTEQEKKPAANSQ